MQRRVLRWGGHSQVGWKQGTEERGHRDLEEGLDVERQGREGFQAGISVSKGVVGSFTWLWKGGARQVRGRDKALSWVSRPLSGATQWWVQGDKGQEAPRTPHVPEAWTLGEGSKWNPSRHTPLPTPPAPPQAPSSPGRGPRLVRPHLSLWGK